MKRLTARTLLIVALACLPLASQTITTTGDKNTPLRPVTGQGMGTEEK